MQSSPNMSTCEEQGKVGEKTDRSGFKLQSLMWMWCSQDLALKKKKKDNQTNRIKLQPPLIPFYSRYLCVCVICAYVCAPVRIHVCFCTCVFFFFFWKAARVCSCVRSGLKGAVSIEGFSSFLLFLEWINYCFGRHLCLYVSVSCTCVCVCVCVCVLC